MKTITGDTSIGADELTGSNVFNADEMTGQVIFNSDLMEDDLTTQFPVTVSGIFDDTFDFTFN